MVFPDETTSLDSHHVTVGHCGAVIVTIHAPLTEGIWGRGSCRALLQQIYTRDSSFCIWGNSRLGRLKPALLNSPWSYFFPFCYSLCYCEVMAMVVFTEHYWYTWVPCARTERTI